MLPVQCSEVLAALGALAALAALAGARLLVVTGANPKIRAIPFPRQKA